MKEQEIKLNQGLEARVIRQSVGKLTTASASSYADSKENFMAEQQDNKEQDVMDKKAEIQADITLLEQKIEKEGDSTEKQKVKNTLALLKDEKSPVRLIIGSLFDFKKLTGKETRPIGQSQESLTLASEVEKVIRKRLSLAEDESTKQQIVAVQQLPPGIGVMLKDEQIQSREQQDALEKIWKEFVSVLPVDQQKHYDIPSLLAAGIAPTNDGRKFSSIEPNSGLVISIDDNPRDSNGNEQKTETTVKNNVATFPAKDPQPDTRKDGTTGQVVTESVLKDVAPVLDIKTRDDISQREPEPKSAEVSEVKEDKPLATIHSIDKNQSAKAREDVPKKIEASRSSDNGEKEIKSIEEFQRKLEKDRKDAEHEKRPLTAKQQRVINAFERVKPDSEGNFTADQNAYLQHELKIFQGAREYDEVSLPIEPNSLRDVGLRWKARGLAQRLRTLEDSSRAITMLVDEYVNWETFDEDSLSNEEIEVSQTYQDYLVALALERGITLTDFQKHAEKRFERIEAEMEFDGLSNEEKAEILIDKRPKIMGSIAAVSMEKQQAAREEWERIMNIRDLNPDQEEKLEAYIRVGQGPAFRPNMLPRQDQEEQQQEQGNPRPGGGGGGGGGGERKSRGRSGRRGVEAEYGEIARQLPPKELIERQYMQINKIIYKTSEDPRSKEVRFHVEAGKPLGEDHPSLEADLDSIRIYNRAYQKFIKDAEEYPQKYDEFLEKQRQYQRKLAYYQTLVDHNRQHDLPPPEPPDEPSAPREPQEPRPLDDRLQSLNSAIGPEGQNYGKENEDFVVSETIIPILEEHGYNIDYYLQNRMDELSNQEKIKLREEYRRLGKWIKVVYDNATDERDAQGNVTRHRSFTMRDDKYAALQMIKNNFRLDLDPGNIRNFKNMLENDVQLQEYFNGIDAEPGSEEVNNIEQLMEAIIAKNKKELYDVGSRYQLLDEWGEPQVQNFDQWWRNYVVQLKIDNPNAEISPLTQVNVRLRFYQLSLYDMCRQANLFQIRRFQIRGNENENNGIGQTSTFAQDPQAHEEFEANKEQIVGTAWRTGITNSRDALYRQVRANQKQLVETMAKMMTNSEMTGDGAIVNDVLKASSVIRSEYLDHGKNKTQGRVGTANRKAISVMFHISEIQAYYEDLTKGANDPDRAVFLDDNGRIDVDMVHKILARQVDQEGNELSDGMKAFYLSIAEDALNKIGRNDHPYYKRLRNQGMSEEQIQNEMKKYRNPKQVYTRFVIDMLKLERQRYLTEEFQNNQNHPDYIKARNIINNRIRNLEGKSTGETKIRFDTIDDVVEVKMLIQKTITGRRVEDDEIPKILEHVKGKLVDPNIQRYFINKLDVMLDDQRAEAVDAHGNYIRDPDGFIRNLGKNIRDPRGIDKNPLIREQARQDLLLQFANRDYESFGLSLLENVLGIKRTEINIFDTQTVPSSIDTLVKKAVAAASSDGLWLEDNEVRYSQFWVNSMLYWTEIAARNDTRGVGWDGNTKLDSRLYRHRAAEGRGGSGNPETIFHFKRYSPTFWEALRVRLDGELYKGEQNHQDGFDYSLLEVCQGGEGSKVNFSGIIGSAEFEGGAEKLFYELAKNNAFALLDLLMDEDEMSLWKVITYDGFGYPTLDYHQAHKIMGTWWKAVRYYTDQYGFNWKKKSRVYDKVVATHNGHAVRDTDGKLMYKKQYDVQDLRHSMFSDEIINMGMNKDPYFGGTFGDNDRDMARNVMAFIVGKELQMHRELGTIHGRYSIDTIIQFQTFFSKWAQEVMHHDHHGHSETLITKEFFTAEQWKQILAVFNSSYGKMYLGEFAVASLQGWGDAFLTMLASISKQLAPKAA